MIAITSPLFAIPRRRPIDRLRAFFFGKNAPGRGLDGVHQENPSTQRPIAGHIIPRPDKRDRPKHETRNRSQRKSRAPHRHRASPCQPKPPTDAFQPQTTANARLQKHAHGGASGKLLAPHSRDKIKPPQGAVAAGLGNVTISPRNGGERNGKCGRGESTLTRLREAKTAIFLSFFAS